MCTNSTVTSICYGCYLEINMTASSLVVSGLL